MKFTIWMKLVLLGLIAIGALSISSYLSYSSGMKVKDMNDHSRYMQSNRDMSIRMTKQYNTFSLGYYQALADRSKGLIDKKDSDAITENLSAFHEMLERFMERKTRYPIDKLKEEMAVMESVAPMLQNELPKLVENRASEKEFEALNERVEAKLAVLGQIAYEADDAVREELLDVASAVNDAILASNKKILIVLNVALAIMVPMLFLIILSITRPLRNSTSVATALAEGDYMQEVRNTNKSDEIGQLARSMLELRKSVEKSVHLQNMIDNLSMPVILCDKEFNISYANQATLNALKKVERWLPVSVSQVVGSSIDVFHKKPQHQRSLLSDSSKLPHQAQFQIGDEWLLLNANALPSRDGSFQGAFIDWRIVTEEVRNAEKEKQDQRMVALAQEKIQELISAAIRGDLAKRIDSSQFQGFYMDLAESMNGLMDAIVEPINKAVGVLDSLASGNLTAKMDGQYEGSFAAMRDALDSTIARLYDMVRKIIEAAQSVNAAASEIAAASTDLSQRTETQASSLEETAASMEEITTTVKQNSTNAVSANDLSTEANKVAIEGGSVVKEAVSAMNSIEKSSKKISDIIGVIDEIAFQINLLALNAAVEAARAGEAGKGFAVVASEVRSLAGRSASASKEIKALINESASHVQSGAQLVNQAGETLENIIESVKKVAGMVSDIAAASKEQAIGIDEINSGINQMDEMTQQNAAMVEQNTAAANSMRDQAKELEDLMSFFKIDEDADNRASANMLSYQQGQQSTKQIAYRSGQDSDDSINDQSDVEDVEEMEEAIA